MLDLQDKLINLFLDTPYPNDAQVHAFAEDIGIPPDQVETAIYGLLSDILSVGRAREKGVTDADVDESELITGINVELEHTPNRVVAKKIALDHLAEMPNYYTQLKRMEAGLL